MTREEAYYILRVSRDEIQSKGHTEFDMLDLPCLDMAISALRGQEELESKLRALESSGWISVEESMPDDWVSVLGHMTDAGEFPSVRECYAVNGNFWFPALREFHPVSHWAPMPTKEES